MTTQPKQSLIQLGERINKWFDDDEAGTEAAGYVLREVQEVLAILGTRDVQGVKAYKTNQIAGTLTIDDKDELIGDIVLTTIDGIGLSIDRNTDLFDRLYDRVRDEINIRLVPAGERVINSTLDLDTDEMIYVAWSVEDVQSRRPLLTREEASEVLRQVKRRHDANDGISWVTLDTHADDLFPNKTTDECATCGSTEITGTDDSYKCNECDERGA